MLACVAADHFIKRTTKSNSLAIVVGFCIVVLGGLASVLHLSHPENILEALNRPQSGIFTEAVLTGLTAAMCFIYWVVDKKSDNEIARKVFAIAAALFGVILSYSAGASYIMASQPTWNTILLPIGFVGVAIPLGVSIYLLIAYIKGESNIKCYQQALAVGGVIALVTSLLYALTSGAFHGAGIVCCVSAIVFSGVCCAVLGYLLSKNGKPAEASSKAEDGAESVTEAHADKATKVPTALIAALVCALIGSVSFHVLQYTGADLINNFYGML